MLKQNEMSSYVTRQIDRKFGIGTTFPLFYIVGSHAMFYYFRIIGNKTQLFGLERAKESLQLDSNVSSI